MLLSKPNLVLDLEPRLFLIMFVNILLVSPLCFFKVRYKLNSKIYSKPHGSILSCWIYAFVHTLDVKLGVQIMICKERCLFRLMNALCCCKQTLPWPKVLTNYLDDNWFYIIYITPRIYWPVLSTHPSKGGKLMTISPSCLKIQWFHVELFQISDTILQKHWQWPRFLIMNLIVNFNKKKLMKMKSHMMKETIVSRLWEHNF
jgi:hypothetical protein